MEVARRPTDLWRRNESARKASGSCNSGAKRALGLSRRQERLDRKPSSPSPPCTGLHTHQARKHAGNIARMRLHRHIGRSSTRCCGRANFELFRLAAPISLQMRSNFCSSCLLLLCLFGFYLFIYFVKVEGEGDYSLERR